MRTTVRRVLPWLLVGAACVRGSRLDCLDRQLDREAAWGGPLAPGEESKVEAAPRITVVSATRGGNCGLREGNETETLAKRCDGRRRCDYMFEDTVIPTEWKGTSGRPCRPQPVRSHGLHRAACMKSKSGR
jgi:hypothetical protein